MLRFFDIIFTTWLLMVLISGSELDNGDGTGNDMRESASEALTKESLQPQSSLLPDVIVETSTTLIPDEFQNLQFFIWLSQRHLLQQVMFQTHKHLSHRRFHLLF